jgi:hypothetical protein
MRKISFILLLCVFASCGNKQGVVFTVKNPLEISRLETISISRDKLETKLKNEDGECYQVKDEATGELLLSQTIDLDDDKVVDEIIFQSEFAPGQEKKFSVVCTADKPNPKLSERRTFGRFVPERIDDFAWENDLVAFRTYGPEAQRLVEANEKGGTLSSGLDCWLKRVDYPVIDKWYKKYVDGGTYHKDDGEGYDPYHVGASRGCGGIGVWMNDSLYVSRNFVEHKVIANGPVRTIVELTYAPWKGGTAMVTEKKTISIDKGSQLYRVDVSLGNADSIPNCTVGVTLHDKKGIANMDSTMGWVSYWETIDDSEIGTGVVIDPAVVTRYLDYRTGKKDLSQLYIVAKPQSGRLSYYTGFGWKKANIITSAESWNQYLTQASQRLASPVTISFETK